MADVLVRRSMVERGEFPPICCKTGERAEVYRSWQFSGGLRGVLPFALGAERRIVRGRRLVLFFGVAFIVLAVVAFVSAVQAATVLAPVAGVALVVTMLLVWLWSPAITEAGADVRLKRVHTAFVEAIRAATTPESG